MNMIVLIYVWSFSFFLWDMAAITSRAHGEIKTIKVLMKMASGLKPVDNIYHTGGYQIKIIGIEKKIRHATKRMLTSFFFPINHLHHPNMMLIET